MRKAIETLFGWIDAKNDRPTSLDEGTSTIGVSCPPRSACPYSTHVQVQPLVGTAFVEPI